MKFKYLDTVRIVGNSFYRGQVGFVRDTYFLSADQWFSFRLMPRMYIVTLLDKTEVSCREADLKLAVGEYE